MKETRQIILNSFRTERRVQTVRHLANVVRIWPKNRIPTFLLLLLFSKESFSGNSFTLSNNRGRTTINLCNPIFPFFLLTSFRGFEFSPGHVFLLGELNYFSILRGNTLHPWRMDTLENFKFLPGCCSRPGKKRSFSSRIVDAEFRGISRGRETSRGIMDSPRFE